MHLKYRKPARFCRFNRLFFALQHKKLGALTADEVKTAALLQLVGMGAHLL